ncbi:MAG: LacI family DNA-binding transcriptional regulator [Anaerolineae bacterium]|nr:LacI family DNA-binding transcriptional regulator [Anaerolineae bacterium]
MKPNPPNRATINDVARMAGVSKSTVSRVLNDREYASSETIERVLHAIETLNYVPQMAARGLVSQRTNALGLVVNELTTLSIPPLMTGIEALASKEKFNLLIAAVGRQAEQSLPLGMHNTDGVLVYADSVTDKKLRDFYKAGFPVVLIHRHPPQDVAIPSVNIENTESTGALISHLIEEHGRRRIAFLRGPENESDSHEREEGYRQALEAHGMPVDPALIGMGMFSETASQRVVEYWIADGVEFDAIFAGDDGAAFGAVQAIKQAGLRVPQDIAVVGFDDSRHATFTDPPLTTVHVPLERVGHEAVKQLIQLVRTGSAESTTLHTHVVLRRSCGCEYNPGS